MTPRPCPGLRRLSPARLGALLLLLTTAAWLWAHEGHLPLPTRGAVVDVERGLINLSPDARAALDVRTAEATLEALEERLTAPATLVAPWQRHALVTTRRGGRVTAVHRRAGDRVRVGQPLAEVASPELEKLQLELLTAYNAAQASARRVKHLERLAKIGTTPAKDVEAARFRHLQD
jgi:membrane fusion protein, heavy metal efflux system